MFTSLASLAFAAVAARLWNIQLRKEAVNRGKQLRESTERLAQIFDAANDGIFVVDPARDEIVKANARAAEIVGYTVDELSSIPMSTLHPNEMPRLKEFSDNVLLSGKGTTDALTCLMKDGTKVPVEMSASVLHQADRKLMLVIVRDITERLRTTESLQERERYLRSVIDGMFAFVGLFSLDGTLVEANQAPLNAAGIRREDVIGKPFWDTYWWSYSEDVQEQLRDALRRAAEGETVRYDAPVCVGESEDGEAKLITIDVSFGPLYDSNGRITQLVGSAVEITERKRAEEKLRDSETKFRGFIESSSDGMIIVDSSSTIMEINATGLAMFGYSREEILEQRIEILIPKRYDAHPRLVGQYWKHPHPRVMAETQALFAVRKDSSEFPIEISLNPLQTREGMIVLASVRDVTQRMQSEEALRASEQQLHQAQKMDALGQLAGGVAHDFNNMLQAIKGYTGLAIEALSVNDPIYEDLKEVMGAAERSAALVRRLLTFSRTRPDEQETINLDDTVSNLLKLLSRVLGEQVDLISQLQSDGKFVLADPSQMEQLLVNLCINARDAMPAGGTITIETNVKRFDKDFCVSNPWASVGEYVTLSVTDNGEGISKEIQDRVFEPFFTTKERGSGTGLGLAAAYAIVTRHDGFLKLDSEPGEGSRFSFFFPTAEPVPADEPKKNDRDAIIGGSETILYAEDEKTIRKLGEHVLTEAGYSVLGCADGEEAIRMALEQGEAIDLAILDVVMPKVGGKAVFDALRELRPAMPVLFTSGYSFDLLGAELLDDEHVALISKPHTSRELLQSVRKLLD